MLSHYHFHFKLHSLIFRTVRNVVKSPKFSHIVPILRFLHWLTINEGFLAHPQSSQNHPNSLHTQYDVQSTCRILLPRLQSAYRPHRSTETATLKVLSDILLAIDAGDLSALVLLDLSAAFDTVDHNTSSSARTYILARRCGT